jgi:hypothetical protein
MDVACLIGIGVTWVLFVLLALKVRRDGDRAVVVEAVQELVRHEVGEQLGKVLKAFREIELEWESTYVKMQRLLGRAARFKQEDQGLHKGAVPERQSLTRQDLKAMLASGSWRTSSTQPSAEPSPE